MSEDEELAAALGLEPQARILEPEIVSPPPKKKKTYKAVKEKAAAYRRMAKGNSPLVDARVQRRDKTFTQVALLDPNKNYVYARLSDRERKLITVLLKTGSKQAAADEIGVTVQTVYNYIKRPFVAAYLEQLRQRAAKAADLTLDKVAGVLTEAVDGKPITPMQLQAASVAAKFLQPARGANGAPITINQQNNFNGPSPFQGLESKDMLEAIKGNLLEMGHEDAAP